MIGAVKFMLANGKALMWAAVAFCLVAGMANELTDDQDRARNWWLKTLALLFLIEALWPG